MKFNQSERGVARFHADFSEYPVNICGSLWKNVEKPFTESAYGST